MRANTEASEQRGVLTHAVPMIAHHVGNVRIGDATRLVRELPPINGAATAFDLGRRGRTAEQEAIRKTKHANGRHGKRRSMPGVGFSRACSPRAAIVTNEADR